MLSANAFNLDQAKILHCGNEPRDMVGELNNPFPNNKILDMTKLKALSDDKTLVK